MKVIELLKRLGVLHGGSETYKGKGEVLGEFYGSEKKKSREGAERNQDNSDISAAARDGESRPEPRAGGSHTGRKVFFWLSLVFGLLCVLIMFAAAGATLWSWLTLLTWAGFSYYAGTYAFAGRGGTGAAVGLFILAIMLSFVFLAIASPEVDSVSSLETSTQSGLQYDGSVWATMTSDNAMQAKENNEFSQGEGAALVLRNVSGFKQGGDGLYRFDMNVVVEDVNGNVVLETDNILGESGHARLPDGIAESPYTAINTAELVPGRYQVHLTVFDRIGGGNLQVSRRLVVR